MIVKMESGVTHSIFSVSLFFAFDYSFHRVMVTDDAQFTATVRYIHQNPQKHGFVDDFRD